MTLLDRVGGRRIYVLPLSSEVYHVFDSFTKSTKKYISGLMFLMCLLTCSFHYSGLLIDV